MQWHSLSEFAAMGGYALYVWGSLGACLAGMLIEPWLLRQRRLRVLRTLQRLRIAEPSRSAPLADKPLSATMKPRHQRLALIVGALAVLGIAAALVLNALQSNLAFFYTPTQVIGGEAPRERVFRVGGLVKDGSLHRDALTVSFIITDTARDLPVRYTGILPDLFKEGKGAVAQGRLDASGQFVAAEVLAKHDENYMPPEAKHAVDEAHKAARTIKP